MTPLANPQPPPGNPNPAIPPIIAPGRVIEHTVRKAFPDGRVLEFSYRQQTCATIHGTYETTELIQSPTLDCSCSAADRDDAVACAVCSAIVCARRHAATCMICGRTCCSRCLQGVSPPTGRAIACRPCANDLTASRVRKLARAVKHLVWGT